MLYSQDPVTSAKLHPRTALILLTALNLLNYVDRSVLFAVQPLVAGFRAVDPALLEVAATLGASPLRAFRTITLPLAGPSLITAAVLTFTHTVGEFGVVLMLGGNIPGATRTLSIAPSSAEK